MSHSDIDRIKLLISYNLKKTYSENLLEQPESVMDRRLGIERKNMQALGYNPSYPSDIKKYQSSITNISGENISDVLLKAREFLFSTTGMVTQIMVSILGAEIGAPIAVAALDVAILINDLQLMVKNWEEKPFNNEESWFLYHIQNNVGFKNSVEDIVFLATGGVLRLIGKTAKGAWNMIKSLFGPKGSFKIWIKSVWESVISNFKKIPYLPSVIKNWANKQKVEAEKAINLLSKGFKPTSKSVLKQIPKSITGGFIVYGMVECIFPKIFGNNESEIIQNGISAIISANPELKLTGKETFILPKQNCMTKTMSKFIYIDDKKYIVVNPDEGMKLKRI